MHLKQVKTLLAQQREEFRASLADRKATDGLASFAGRIAVVLSGGGARGAYEAGVLLAFQDASMPTHILAATSVGSINAASYAAHSKTVVGNAESLVESWLSLTPPAVGIEWTRYTLMLAGFLAAAAGFGNLFWEWLRGKDIVFIHLHDPKLTWLFLGLAGAAVLFLYDHIPYIGHVLGKLIRRERWHPETKKLALSLLANVVVLSFVSVVLSPAHLHTSFTRVLQDYPKPAATALAILLMFVLLMRRFRNRISLVSHQVLRMPFRSGLFPNLERTRFLRERIPIAGLRASPIRVVMTTTEMQSGRERFFSNASRAALQKDPGANPAFVAKEIEPAEDLMQVVIASSALPIVYESVPLNGTMYADGGIVMNQPVRPAVNLGADILFFVSPGAQREKDHDLRTFLDVGLRSIEIMMAQSLRTDLRFLNRVNQMCEKHAAELDMRPEQVAIDMGHRTYRYVKLFSVRPAEPLGFSRLDFEGRTLWPAILQGYTDGCKAVFDFLAYVLQAPPAGPKRIVALSHNEP